MRHVRGIIAVFVAAAVLALLLLPSAAPQRTAHAAVQQPYQCPRATQWDIFSFFSFASGNNDIAVDDVAPRHDPRHFPQGNMFGVIAGVKNNDHQLPDAGYEVVLFQGRRTPRSSASGPTASSPGYLKTVITMVTASSTSTATRPRKVLE
jgi:hypothetical protein